MTVIDLNYFTILVAAVVSLLLGAWWYSPFLFGKFWSRLTDISPHEKKEMRTKQKISYVINFVTSLLSAYILAYVIAYMGATTFLQGMEAGFWMWLGFVATVSVGLVIWENKPVFLYLLNNGYYLLSFLLMGGILAAFS